MKKEEEKNEWSLKHGFALVMDLTICHLLKLKVDLHLNHIETHTKNKMGHIYSCLLQHHTTSHYSFSWPLCCCIRRSTFLMDFHYLPRPTIFHIFSFFMESIKIKCLHHLHGIEYGSLLTLWLHDFQQRKIKDSHHAKITNSKQCFTNSFTLVGPTDSIHN